MDFLVEECGIKQEQDVMSGEEDGGSLEGFIGTPHFMLSDLGIEDIEQEGYQSKHLKLGQTFQSFADVSTAVRKYEIEKKVNLAAKYFRRIAANPKPSNKEDFELSVEERKRFVYRWVDFCCVYYDGRIGNEEQGNSEIPPVGFSAKECPMRIRFQLRSAEKDLIVSTCKETHDHNSHMPHLKTQGLEAVIHAEKSRLEGPYSNCDPKPKATRPPPSLNALPNVGVPPRPGISPSEQKFLGGQRSSLPPHKAMHNSLPKPPPLKRGVVISSAGGPGVNRVIPRREMGPNSMSLSTAPTSNPVQMGVSVKSVITNLYNYLLQTKNEGPEPDGVGFLSSNPNIIRITAKMAGVEEAFVSQVVQSKRTPAHISSSSSSSPGQFITSRGQQLQTPLLRNHQNNQIMARKRHTGMIKPQANMQELRRKFSIQNQARRAQIAIGAVLKRRRFPTALQNRSESPKTFDLPLEVIIKSEPDSNQLNRDGEEGDDMELEEGSLNFDTEYSAR